uniref:Uncharacterized protein n=1 Tax=Chloropicon laureae TaxID=464258 RepID=A0A7S2Z6P9_9CHLO|mmetsp:Transcript_7930/g.20377  ORF Transcript_7930/g.20377 Transcript_7930/m.20377 type:complete len:370 (+) Transcript_7930:189-1298(+)
MGDLADHRRALLPFLQRAEEVAKVEPKVAYYCRLYAVEEGLKLKNRSKAIEELLVSVMDKLEQFKKGNPGALNAEEDKLLLEGFALKIFARADRVDRAGKASMSTCKAFYAASVFMEVCTQFGALDEDLLGKQKYAAWKAADIRKALREGRTPTPGSGVEPKSYSPGTKVWVKVDEVSPPVQGAVLSSDDQQLKFLVSLPSGSQELKAGQLALHAVPGTQVTYKGEPGKVLSVDLAVWPPSYEVEHQNGVVSTEETHLTVVAAPAAPAPVDASVPPPAAMPSAPPSAPPPSAPSPAAPSPSPSPAPAPKKQVPAPRRGGGGSQAGFTPSLLQMNDAQRQAKVAVSSLGFQDYKSAIQYLQKALDLLQGN